MKARVWPQAGAAATTIIMKDSATELSGRMNA
jgi:hypothetical protein